MERLLDFVWVIPALPALGAVVLLLFGKRIGEPRAGYLATTTIAGAFVWSCVMFIALQQQPGAARHHVYNLWQWFSGAGSFSVHFGFLVDPLSVTMILFVTGIGALIHLYSISYMHGDPRFSRFFAYLNLFAASMLILVLGSNFLMTFMGWEGVGLCSYLLISFWFERNSAAVAGKKAFVTNRVGDFGLLLGILGLFWATGSFGFEEIGARLQEAVAGGSVSNTVAVILCLLVFMGPMAKSAQFPLHVWLPDAMEGPTPISALIHAATMVAAGVFLVARLQPVYEAYPAVQVTIAVIGTITLFLGASIALTQMDLKKGLAYSTVSQLGYMMLAMGCGAPVAGMFHLVTHAFFKAMLFLGSGSVIHAMEEVVGHEPVLAQDMRLMGGLRRWMPVTSSTFLIGCIAIAGIPPLAGFWSKDEILGQAFNTYPLLWAMGFITAGMTAFYMFRLYFLTFEGDFRGTDKAMQAQLMVAAGKGGAEHDEEHGHGHHASHPHESGWQMAMPLAVLAVPSVLIGLLGTPWNSRFARLLDPEEAAHMARHFSWGEFLPLAGASVAISVVGITVAVLAYAMHKLDMAALFANRFPAINAFLANKWYLDDINDKLFVQGSRRLARSVLEVDSKVVDGVVNLTGLVTLGSGEGLKYFETGRAQFYALIVFGGVIALVVLFGALG